MSRLTTPYIDMMDNDCPHSYHPTPQFKREDYLCLNGKWDFCQKTEEVAGEYNDKILVPFPPESQLSGIERAVLPEHYLHTEPTSSCLYPSAESEYFCILAQ